MSQPTSSQAPPASGRPPHTSAEPSTEVSLSPSEGWHCSHLYYAFDRGALAAMAPGTISKGREQLIEILDPAAADSPERMQISAVTGHKADLGLMLLDANPLVVDSVHQRILASALGPALRPTYSFVSLTEVSEYVPTAERYGDRLVEEGVERDSPAFNAKVKAYEQREVIMRKQRLTPDLPEWPSTCFYPMNKKRKVGENWFLLGAEDRHKLMAEHGRTGMTFGGRVTQLITVGLGLEDWEWGVTLWARNPEFLKEIVYKMRFDEASARYAEFGPFYTSYVMSAKDVLDHCRIGC